MSDIENSYAAFSIRIVALSPLAMGNESKLGNFEQTINFIPGTALRGALGAKSLQACTQPDYFDDHSQCPDRETCPFWVLFKDDKILFGNAYPGLAGPVFPFPLTARTCKYYPGLPQDDRLLDEQHGVFDILVERFVFELLSDPSFPERNELLTDAKGAFLDMDDTYQEHCPECNQPLEPITGYYTPGPRVIPGSEPFIRRMVHVGINRARFVAEDGLLYSQEVLDTRDTRTHFFGRLIVPESRVEQIKQSLKGKFYLGSGRSRGYGQVDVGLNPLNDLEELDARVHAFQNSIKVKLSKWSARFRQVPDQLSGTLVSLTLRSPAILESFGRAHLVPSPAEIGLPAAKLLRAWTSPVVVSGWDSAAGLPRRTRLAACAGSVFLYHLPPGTELKPLANLEMAGLGAERGRGFGQVEVCAPFHTQFTRKAGGSHA